MRYLVAVCGLLVSNALMADLSFCTTAVGAPPVRKTIEAHAGKPFGVGKFEIEFPITQGLRMPAEAPCWLSEKSGRVLYPVCEIANVHTGLDNPSGEVGRITGWFVFRGDEPLNVSLDAGPEYFRLQATPTRESADHARLLREWWQQTTRRATLLASSDIHPLHVENYLVSMLSRRLKQTPPTITQSLTGRRDYDSILGTLLGTESIRLAMQKEATLGRSASSETASEPLPTAVSPPPVTIPAVPKDVQIEEMAMHVPQECFYIRCQNMPNYRWLRQNIDRWGANIRDLTAGRSIDFQIREHLEQQLSLKEGILARLFGRLVVSDIAFIGCDTFFREGAAVGVVFQSTSSPILGNQIKAQRRAVLKENPEATESEITLAGKTVSLLETPDHSVRSYYAVDGAFHLVTNSATIARRFLEAGAGKSALGALEEFRHTRNLLPTSRDDTLFVYFSDPFFNQLVSPAYRVEMTRRMQAEADLEVLTLARLAAVAEKQPAGKVEELIAAGFLPADFGKRPDGSRPLLASDGKVSDSVRGRRRSFVPIPDIAVSRVTPTERKSYDDFANLYRGIWQRMDPIAFAVRKSDDPQRPEIERVSFDLHVSPLAREPYGTLARVLNKPDRKQLAEFPGDLVRGEALLGFTDRWTIPLNRNFLGLRDVSLPYAISRGSIVLSLPRSDQNRHPASFPIYLAGQRVRVRTKEQGKSEEFPLPSHAAETTTQVSSPILGTLWHRWNSDFELLALEEQLPAEILPQLKLVKAERSAQIRLKIADLAASRAAGLIQASSFCRARQASQCNVNLMHSLIQQLHVAPPQALAVYGELLAGEPVCPLGGTYQQHETGPGPVRWRSSAWQQDYLSQVDSTPPNFKSPFLEWFHGLQLEFTVDPVASVLSTHIEVDLKPDAGEN